jgi:hypothetical protein
MSECKWPACSCKATGVKCKDYKDPKAKKKNEVKRERIVQKNKDFLFYMEIWNERPHVCSNPDCNKPLGNQFSSIYMDHILEKGDKRYKHLRHEKQNICILCWDCHTSKKFIKYLIELRNKTLELFGLQ